VAVNRARAARAVGLTRLRPVAVPVLIGVLLAGALVLRLPGITKPSIEQRETQSALRARAWYLGDGEGLPAWQQRVLGELQSTVRLIEPPVIDFFTSLQFRVAGENFWFPRLLSALSWVLGGIFLYLIARRLTSREGSLVALALYLTWPFAARHSRLFMPDALMVACLLAAGLTVLRYWERPSTRRLLVAGVVSSAATAVKPGVALPYLVALFVALALSHRQLRRTVIKGHLLLYVVLAGLTSGLYYVWGTRFSDYIWDGASSDRLTPELALHWTFWEHWWEAVSYLLKFPQPQTVLAVAAIAVGLAGIVVADRRHARATLVGLVVGYVAFAVTFAYYISGNPYYSLPLIAILSLAIGVFAGFALERSGGGLRIALGTVIVIVLAVATYKSAVILGADDPEGRIADYRRIGDITGHTTRALVVNDQLTTPLKLLGMDHRGGLGALPRDSAAVGSSGARRFPHRRRRLRRLGAREP
jgi:4-amino-4-deoxy-L-arabinose transferase-like glycosyltransferase